MRLSLVTVFLIMPIIFASVPFISAFLIFYKRGSAGRRIAGLVLISLWSIAAFFMIDWSWLF